ncbi:LacI family DNA-binding transcriptional regulator [Rhodobacter sphaeroides]|uniref:Transcriptional regulator, LacI family n=1 Tax=Cereibacter sphaeroides (strain ATCC 17023 / DSM 158 / JCM 6121 / CCUG 31486 / LMG 2827 / NBRC 12203 / NCIMB 8253 / ATH 2.4.1.) TaxID=272943 RepID=Q3IYG0_CERS4|nr:LacI family DNA-binding transcriptional regulator [Cereibacter sphaeroides]ABA80424.1 transcriptional regulator, LacI family [Cereibacter sphaeroides 2.4.1]AMJ48655.1 LacI family transcriptional regulator [Cereibacter sphaeroides]ANS35370.1 LacI family transcriptional regulator [Cereibacter sphaeroides]ATN64423.1 LacI family transcriptional regulator [Cereibacter sphaeroides]AXC62610.1 LacI family transcriptional regulator [Cereibacter sphaeroides 2.4.1]
MRQKVATIQDVARLSGVSTATVSRALSHPDRVAEPTREAVLRAVRETGYVANPMARNLRRRRTGSILALVPNLANPFFSEILSGLASVLTPAGYGLLIADTHTDPAGRLTYYLESGLADGVVVFDGTLPEEALATRRRPPVILACEWMGETLPSVRVDNAAGAEIAIRHLYEMGHRRIGHAMGPVGNVLTESRLAGARRELEALGLPLREDWIFRGDFGLASGSAAAMTWLGLKERPTAVFCASDEAACGFMGALQHAGISVPSAVSVVGFDDIEVAAHLVPPLTTIRQPRRQIGRRAGELLSAMIEARALGGPSELLPVELIRRQSVAPPPPGQGDLP